MKSSTAVPGWMFHICPENCNKAEAVDTPLEDEVASTEYNQHV